MSRRQISVDRAKMERRTRIVDAAECLIRESRSTEFSMQALARRAGLSTNTTYNLIGSKATVLYTILNRSIDRIDAVRVFSKIASDPIKSLIHAGDSAVEVFIAEPNFYRPLLKFLFSAEEPVQRTAFMNRSFSYWTQAVEPLVKSGHLLGKPLNSIDIARDMLIFFTGATEFWVHNDMNADEFRAQVRHGVSLRMLSILDGVEQKVFAGHIADIRLTFACIPQRENDLQNVDI